MIQFGSLFTNALLACLACRMVASKLSDDLAVERLLVERLLVERLLVERRAEGFKDKGAVVEGAVVNGPVVVALDVLSATDVAFATVVSLSLLGF